jgi:hypothetical protein
MKEGDLRTSAKAAAGHQHCVGLSPVCGRLSISLRMTALGHRREFGRGETNFRKASLRTSRLLKSLSSFIPPDHLSHHPDLGQAAELDCLPFVSGRAFKARPYPFGLLALLAAHPNGICRHVAAADRLARTIPSRCSGRMAVVAPAEGDQILATLYLRQFAFIALSKRIARPRWATQRFSTRRVFRRRGIPHLLPLKSTN